MAYFRTCPLCGSNLDAGEHCDCVEEKKREEKRRSSLFIPDQTGQITFRFTVEEEREENHYVDDTAISGGTFMRSEEAVKYAKNVV